MGTGNKLKPAAFEVADIYQTSVCPLAHVMRKELRRRGIEHLKVVYSKEKPFKQHAPELQATDSPLPRKSIPASAPFVPPVAGFIIAGEVVKDLINTD
jgi:tRNA A37 threonylcarbamoyladenosine dehydratase